MNGNSLGPELPNQPGDASLDTRLSLITRLKDPGDHEAWSQFEQQYRPIVLTLARTHGLQAADAEDLAQMVLVRISKAIDGFEPDPERAKFRTWLKRIAKNAIINALTRPGSFRAAGGSDARHLLDQVAQPNALTETIQWNYRREIFRRSADQIQTEFSDDVWQSFWMTAVENRPAPEVARKLNRSVGAVYTARSRVLRRLREVVARIDDQTNAPGISSQTTDRSI